MSTLSEQDAETPKARPKHALWLVAMVFLVASALVGTAKLDVDEFGFIKEPYEMLGGDYTLGYLREHSYREAFEAAVKAYYFYWKYRSLTAPIIEESDKRLFAKEEAKFGYSKPESVAQGDPDALAKYSKRLIAPEPDRFYRHGTGKPLLSAFLSLPQLALLKLAESHGGTLLSLQMSRNYHPRFILARLMQIVLGLATLIAIYRILQETLDEKRALFAAALFAAFPLTIRFFPNIHHDSILPLFTLLSAYWFSKRSYSRAGVAYGLALAAKNAAVFLFPAFFGMIIWELYVTKSANPTTDFRGAVWERIRGLMIVLALAVVCLVPFANPVSYAREVLTPITHRDYDTRGQRVESFTIGGRVDRVNRRAAQKVGASLIRPEVALTNSLFRYGDVGFFFFILAAFSVVDKIRTNLGRLSFLMLLLLIPYGFVFGDTMKFRHLMFVPFFVMLCVETVTARYLGFVLAILGILDVVMFIDPVTTTVGTKYLLVDNVGLWSAVSGWLVGRF